MAIISWICLLGGVAVGQVNLPEGFEIVEFGVSEVITSRPAINDCGQIVYRKDRKERTKIYLYDNGAIRTVAESQGELLVGSPDINDIGTIIWTRGRYLEPYTWEIIMLKDDKLTRVGRGNSPSINNSDVVTAQLYRKPRCSSAYDLVFYEGNKRTRITRRRGHTGPVSPEINDLGEIAWSYTKFCIKPWEGGIQVYSDGEIKTLPSKYREAQGPDINNSGDVVWSGLSEILIYQNGQTRTLTEFAGIPAISNLGDVYFSGWDFERETHAPWLYRVSGGEPTFHRLIDEATSSSRGNVNDWGEVAWWWWYKPLRRDFAGGVGFLRRIRTGDSEFDGDVDLIDYAALADCMTGPGRMDRLCDCRFLDIDHDGDVDLGDFALFQNAFGGR